MTALRNNRFSGGWYHPDGIPELQIPEEWIFTDYSGTPNLIDPAPHSVFVRPEVRVLTPAYLPPAEWPVFVSPENTQALKAFKGYGAWYSAFSQSVGLLAGNYAAVIEVFPDLVDRYEDGVKVWAADPLSGRVRVLVDEQAVTDWVNLIAGSRVTLRLPFATGAGSNIAFEFMLPFPLNNSGLFLSRLDVEDDEPTPPDCRGKPREQYERTYHVYYPEATAEQRRALSQWCADNQKTFGPSFDDAGIGDLDIRYAVCHYVPAARHPEFVAWFADWYPGVIVSFEDTPEEPQVFRLTYPTTHLPPEITQPFIWPVPPTHGGLDLASSWARWGDKILAAFDGVVLNDTTILDSKFGYQVLTRCTHDGKNYDLRYAHFVEPSPFKKGDTVKRGQEIGKPDSTGYSTGDHLHFSVYSYVAGDYIDPAPLIDWPDDNPTPPEPQYPLRSKNCVGLHSSFVRAQSWSYIEQSGTNIQKFFSAGDAYLAGLRAPGIVSIWRKYVGNDGIGADIPAHTQWLLDQYSVEIETTSAALGVSVEELLSKITAGESLNEQIPTYNVPILQRAVEFDCVFAEKLWARYGNLLGAVLLCGAVGNPHESEVHYMLPAARAAEQYNGFIGYHAYWAHNETQSFLASGWPYHAGRWQEWDKAFVAAGIYVRYALGEGGICYAPDGWSFNSGAGWKSCGPFSTYLTDINEFNTRVLAWNAAHGNRCPGIMLFCYGCWDWGDFELGDGDVNTLANWGAALNGTRAMLSFSYTPVDDRRAKVAALETYLNTAPYIEPERRASLAWRLAQEKKLLAANL